MPIATKTTPQSEFWARIIHPYYNPRRRPFPIPTARWDEAPCWSLCINEQWASHVLALLDLLDQWDTWVGTDEEIDAARVQVNEFIACFMESAGMCCCGGNNEPQQPVLHRVTTDGQMQVSYDGGVTWEQDPNDPRVTGTTLPAPIPAGQSATKCDAATNGLEHLKDAVAAVSESLAVAETVVAVMAAIATFIVTIMFGSPEVIPLIYPLVVALATAAFGVGKSAFDAAFTNTVWDAMLCILYCRIGDDGHFTQQSFSLVLADIPIKITDPTASYQLKEIIKAMGMNGLNNICSYGNASLSDCAACECDCETILWGIWNGIGTDIVYDSDENGNYIEATAVLDEANFGGYAVVFTTGISELCCTLGAATELNPSGNDSGVWVYNLCGEEIIELGEGFPHSGLIPSLPVNTVGHNGTIPFVMRVYLTS